MNAFVAFLILLLAAILEAGGDALVRTGLQGNGLALRIGSFIAGGIILFAYGMTVNAPQWDFGQLLGVYVTLFFVVAQVINLLFFGVRPGAPILVGGAMVVGGGLVMTFWRP